MANTTISISRKFHDWLKTKGDKGDSYEKIITRLLKTEIAHEYEKFEFKDIEKKAEPKADSNDRDAAAQTSESELKEDKPKSDIIDSLFEGKID